MPPNFYNFARRTRGPCIFNKPRPSTPTDSLRSFPIILIINLFSVTSSHIFHILALLSKSHNLHRQAPIPLPTPKKKLSSKKLKNNKHSFRPLFFRSAHKTQIDRFAAIVCLKCTPRTYVRGQAFIIRFCIYIFSSIAFPKRFPFSLNKLFLGTCSSLTLTEI